MRRKTGDKGRQEEGWLKGERRRRRRRRMKTGDQRDDAKENYDATRSMNGICDGKREIRGDRRRDG